MQENNSLNANLILKKLKKALKISTDIQLSEFLNIKPNTISTWKKRNSLDFAAIISICELYEVDLNDIFLDKRNVKDSISNYTSETPLVSREMQFQYCINSAGLIESLPKFNFPFVRGEDTRAFQVVSNNMSPIIEENSFVVCEPIQLKDLSQGDLAVITSKEKGLFINRVLPGTKPDAMILQSENSFYSDVSLSFREISEVWLIKGVLSYNINLESYKPQLEESKKVDQEI